MWMYWVKFSPLATVIFAGLEDGGDLPGQAEEAAVAGAAPGLGVVERGPDPDLDVPLLDVEGGRAEFPLAADDLAVLERSDGYGVLDEPEEGSETPSKSGA